MMKWWILSLVALLFIQLYVRLQAVREQHSNSVVDVQVAEIKLQRRLDRNRLEAKLAETQMLLASRVDQVRRLEAELHHFDERLIDVQSRHAISRRAYAMPIFASNASATNLRDRRRHCEVYDETVVCAARAPSLAIVIPFPPKQLHFVRDNLDVWAAHEFYPCERGKRVAQHVNLLFYLSQPDNHTQSVLRDAFFDAPWRRDCFASIGFKFIDMDEQTDVYGPGTLAMFYSSFDDGFFHRPRDYMLWMEPDLVPVRRHWLDQLYERELVMAPHFWMRGSIPRYPYSDGDWHLNGNALYAVGDPAFASFAKNSRGAFKPYDSFDQSLFAKYQQDPKPYAHLFVYSNALQNRGYDIYNIPQFRTEEPDALLCHGKGMLQSVKRFAAGEEVQHYTQPRKG